MLVSIHQPNLLPRLKVLQKIAAADLNVVLDDVQYSRQEWQNRAFIVPLSTRSEGFWFTIPVRRHEGLPTRISSVQVAMPDLARLHLEKIIYTAFGKSQYLRQCLMLIPRIAPLQLAQWGSSTTQALLSLAKQGESAMMSSSSLAVTSSGTTRIAEICEAVGATGYIADSGAARYLNPKLLPSGIELLWQHWSPPSIALAGTGLAWRNVSSVNLVARGGPQALEAHIAATNLRKRPPIERRPQGSSSLSE